MALQQSPFARALRLEQSLPMLPRRPRPRAPIMDAEAFVTGALQMAARGAEQMRGSITRIGNTFAPPAPPPPPEPTAVERLGLPVVRRFSIVDRVNATAARERREMVARMGRRR